MKNYLTLVVALAVVSTPAFASRARLEALGEGKNGSYYIDDARNQFLNPATIVRYKKKLMLELGGDTVGTADASTAGSNRGQGGFTNTFGDFTYSLYLNNTSDNFNNAVALGNAISGGTDFLAPDSTVEFALAGEGSMNWGLSVIYVGNNDKSLANGNRTVTGLGTRLGVEAGNLAVFSTIGILGKSELNNAGSDQAKSKVSLDLAATYKMDNMTVYAKGAMSGTDFERTGESVRPYEFRRNAYGIGAGWKHEMTKSANMFARLSLDYQKSTLTEYVDQTYYNLPVVLGAEAQATSWMTLRGSVSQSLIGQVIGNTGATPVIGTTGGAANNRTSLGGSTTVSAGVGLVFGDVNIDGLVATDGATAQDIPGFGTGLKSSSTFGFGDKMISRIALTYNF